MDFFNNIVHFFQAPNPYPGIKSPIPTSQQVTQQMPPGVQSPVPQAQTVAHPAGVSAFQSALDDAHQAASQFGQGASDLVHGFANFFGGGSNTMAIAQTQVPTPTPTEFPGQQQFVQHMMQQNPAQEPQYYNQLYQKAINSPGFSGHYYGEAPTPTPTPTTSTIPQNVPGVNDSFIQTLNNQILPITRAAGIPDAVAAAQTAIESGHGRSPGATKNNNYHGVMQWNGQGVRSLRQFNNPGESAVAYAQTIKNLVPDIAKYKNDPIGLLKRLQSGPQRYEGDNPNPYQYVYNVTQVPEWGAYGGGQPLASVPLGTQQ